VPREDRPTGTRRVEVRILIQGTDGEPKSNPVPRTLAVKSRSGADFRLYGAGSELWYVFGREDDAGY
jgi:hypothetical protein